MLRSHVTSQAVGVVTGIQEKFSFKGVAIAAIGTASIEDGLGAGATFGAVYNNSGLLADGAFGIATAPLAALRLGNVGRIGALGDDFVGVAGGRMRDYRVEGSTNQRLDLDTVGNVTLRDTEAVVWINFGQEARALDFLNRRIGQGLPDATIRSFDVDAGLVQRLRSSAVPKGLAKELPSAPIRSADPFPDQFGLRLDQFNDLRRSIIQGTGRVGP